MALDLTSLVNNLASRLKVCQHLLQLSMQEQEAIIKNKSNEIGPIIEKKNQTLIILDQLDKTKGSILSNFSKELNLKFTPKGIEAIINYLPHNNQEQIRQFVKAIKTTAAKIKAVNTNNAKLLDYSISFINQMMTTFSPTGGNVSTYTSSGVQHSPQKCSFEYSS